MYDFFNMESDEELTILPQFKTHQGVIPYACGPNAVLMILNYYDDFRFDESNLVSLVKCDGINGTKIKNIVDFFRDNGYEVQTSIEQMKSVEGRVFDSYTLCRDFILSSLKNGCPILVESVFYGGHYQVIIGYDKRSDDVFHDMIILADPTDETDDKKDGYVYISAVLFFAMWFDDRYLPVEHRIQPFVVVSKKKCF